MNIDLAYIWHRLNCVTRIHFRAQSGYSTGWNGEGYGIVNVKQLNENVLIFDECGNWKSPDGRSYAFKNVYRWTLASTSLHLEHLRIGVNNPVFLVELQTIGGDKWESQTPHVCGNDLYSGILLARENELNLKWTVQGPKKSETLINIYS